MPFPMRGLVVLVLATTVVGSSAAQGPVNTPRVHALTNVRIVQGPERIIEQGTVVIRDGIIESVGASITPPPDARIWELDSLTVYPGLIDPALSVAPPKAEKKEDKKEDAGPALGHELKVVTPELVLADVLTLKESVRESHRAQGFTTVRALPNRGTFRGQAAVLNLGNGSLNRNLLRRSAGQVLAFSGMPGREAGYPGSTMGVVAVIRQTFLDTRWYDKAHSTYEAHPVGMERPPTNIAYAALSPALKGKNPLIFVTDDVLDILRAGEIGEEFGVSFDFLGSGEEYKRIDEVKAVTRSLIIPVNFPKAPAVGDAGATLDVSLEKLRAWDAAPGNAARLEEAGVVFAFTPHGLKDTGAFRKNVGKAIEAGLSPEVALAAVTTVPARMIGMSDRLGSVEAGKIANLVIVDGDLFAEDTKIRAVWIDGGYLEVEEIKPPEGDPRGTWDMVVTASGMEFPFTLELGGEVGALTASVSMMGQEVSAEATQSGTTVVISFDSSSIGMAGTTRFSMAVTGDSATGSGKSPDGDSFSLTGNRSAKFEADPSGGTSR